MNQTYKKSIVNQNKVIDPAVVLNLPKEYIEKQRERAKKIRAFEKHFNKST